MAIVGFANFIAVKIIFVTLVVVNANYTSRIVAKMKHYLTIEIFEAMVDLTNFD